jgi:hypothetical protein
MGANGSVNEMTQIDIGKGLTLDVPVDKLPSASMEHVVKIGLKNILQDAHAGVKDVAKAREKSEAKLAALMRGEIRSPMAIRAVDPAEKVALMKAIAEIWETKLPELSKVKSAKRDAEARRLAKELLAKRASAKPSKAKAA